MRPGPAARESTPRTAQNYHSSKLAAGSLPQAEPAVEPVLPYSICIGAAWTPRRPSTLCLWAKLGLPFRTCQSRFWAAWARPTGSIAPPAVFCCSICVYAHFKVLSKLYVVEQELGKDYWRVRSRLLAARVLSTSSGLGKGTASCVIPCIFSDCRCTDHLCCLLCCLRSVATATAPAAQGLAQNSGQSSEAVA